MQTSIPPMIAAPRPALAPWVLLAGALGAGMVLYYLLDPAQTHIFPTCYFHEATGLDCPGCGGQRALHQLLRGHVAEAFHLNALLFALLPLGLWLLLWEMVRAVTGRTWPTVFSRPAAIWALAGVIVAFGIARNLPFAPFNLLHP